MKFKLVSFKSFNELPSLKTDKCAPSSTRTESIVLELRCEGDDARRFEKRFFNMVRGKGLSWREMENAIEFEVVPHVVKRK